MCLCKMKLFYLRERKNTNIEFMNNLSISHRERIFKYDF